MIRAKGLFHPETAIHPEAVIPAEAVTHPKP
ncbi:hypothetical protein FraQA3DRAFT_0177 [Frankia sp. QA3]|nr:hypothetical protein FraQA3DRAFT_0177 [Frankia sp. QA3]